MSNGVTEYKLIEICRPRQWKTISTTALTSTGYPVYGANGVIGYYTEYNHETSTILITCRGATCGTINVCEPFSYVTGNAMALDDLDTSKVDQDYLVHLLRFRGFADVISGSAQPQITGEGLKKVKLSFPPLHEQRRIATILDKADAIRRKRRQVIDLMNDFLRSVFLEMFGDPIANSKQLDVCKLGDIVQLVSGGTPSKSNPAFWEGNIPWVSPKDMKRFWLSDSEDHVSSTVPEETNLKMIPDKTVLIVVRGMILAHTVPICMTRVSVTINQDIKALLPTTKINPVYLAWVLLVQHDSILGRVSTASHGTKRLETDVLLATPVTVPPLESQQQFEVIVEKYRELHEKVADQSRLDGVLFNSLSHSLLEAGGT